MDTIAERIEAAAKRETGVVFVAGDEHSRLGWAEVHDRAKAAAARLQQLGVNKGDHVGILGTTSLNVVVGLQATWLLGGVSVVMPLPMRLASIESFVEETQQRIAASDCAALLIEDGLIDFVPTESVDALIVPLSDLEPGALASLGVDSNAFVRPDYSTNDLVVLQFTSGSTSEPKGVMLPNHVIVANLEAIDIAAEVDIDTDVMVSWLPLYHDMGLVGFCLVPMCGGIDLVLGSPGDFMAAPLRWMQWISDYGGTATAGPNFSWALASRALRKDGLSLDLSSLRIALNGAEPVDPNNVRDFCEQARRFGFRDEAIFPAFGMAELAIAGSFPKPLAGLKTDVVDADRLENDLVAEQVAAAQARGSSKNGSAVATRELVFLGGAVQGLEFRIVNDRGDVLGEREVGELQIRGTSVSPGYYKRPDSNRESFVDDWFRTGDLAYLVDGELVICGRIKDLIILAGRNIHPQDIERVVVQVDGVRKGNAVAFGVEDARGKQRIAIVAEVVENTDGVLATAAIKESVLNLTGVPIADVVLVERGSMPKTSSGKLQRALCKRLYADKALTLAGS